ncbi:MAG: hypothetical protein JWP69_2331 [Flaviaesturariibacter sp.]|nr:hypothetical protein [Flaviaesturariibacter sp.]
MKTLFISLSLLASSIFSNAAHINTTISPSALTSFEASFTKAKEIAWQDMGTMYKVNFLLDGISATAFYQPDGKLIGFTKKLSTLSLPSSLKKALQKELKNKWITDLVVLTNEEGTSYFVNLEDADNKMVLKSVNNKKWAFYSKETKL